MSTEQSMAWSILGTYNMYVYIDKVMSTKQSIAQSILGTFGIFSYPYIQMKL